MTWNIRFQVISDEIYICCWKFDIGIVTICFIDIFRRERGLEPSDLPHANALPTKPPYVVIEFCKIKMSVNMKLISKEENLNLCSNLNIYSYIKLSSPAKSWESIYLYTVNDLYVNVNSVKQGFRVKRRGNGALKPQWGFAFYMGFSCFALKGLQSSELIKIGPFKEYTTHL